MIAVAAAYRIETRWMREIDGARCVRTAVGERAPEALDAFAEAHEVSTVVSAGFCGGLGADLESGDLVLADVVRHRGEEILVSPRLLEVARAILADAVHVGACESVSRVADGPRKRALAQGGALSVDMESGPLSRWARSRKIPFLSLRVVFDPVGADIPLDIDGTSIGAALRHPVWSLRAARWAFPAGRALGCALNELLPALKEGP
jgi:nucleoside phosphorylase